MRGAHRSCIDHCCTRAPLGSVRVRKGCVMTRYALAAAALAVALSSSTPIINNVDPATPAPSTKAQVLTIAGQDFMSGLTLTVSDPAGNKAVIQGKAITGQTATSFQAPV